MIHLPRDFSRICMDFPGFHLFIIYFFGLLYKFYNALAICIDVDAKSGVIVGVLCLKLPKAGLGKWLWSCTNHGKLLPFLIEILPISSNWAAGTTSNNLVEKLRSNRPSLSKFSHSQFHSHHRSQRNIFRNRNQGLGLMSLFWGFVSHHQNKYLLEMISPIVG